MKHTDVVVVGAGPAGSAAAMTLARAGIDVTIIDKAAFPREKCCGDGLTSLALRRLEQLGLEPSTLTTWQDVDVARIRSPGGRVVDLPLPRDRGRYAAVVRRSELDAQLLDLASRCGAAVLENVALASVEPGSLDTTITTTQGEAIRARYIVAADGAWSTTRKALGLHTSGYRGEWHAFRQYRQVTGPESRDLWVWFEPDLLPGYAWSFPLPDGGVNVGFGVLRGASLSGKKMAELWRELCHRPHIAEILGTTKSAEPHRAWPIPARLPQATLTGPRTLFVGDAASAADPMTGEGIGQALETGTLAAEAVIQGGAWQPDTVATTYEKSARAALQADHHAASLLSSVLRSPRLTEAAIRTVAMSGWGRRNFARWMFEDYPRAILATPRRWTSDTFTRDGAYPST